MTTDQKVEEVLKLVREYGGRSEVRDNELLGLIREERVINNARFTQVATGLVDVKKEVSELRVDLNAKIDKVYESLSQDIQVFGEDLHHVKRRVTRIEKKLLS